MSYLPQTDAALAHAVQTGAVCAECVAESFVKPYGKPTLCVECWNERCRVATEGFHKATRRDQQSVVAAKATQRRKA